MFVPPLARLGSIDVLRLWGSATDAAIKATMVMEDAGETNAGFQPYRVWVCEDVLRPDGRHGTSLLFWECRRHLWRQESHPGGVEVGGGAGEGVAPPGQGAPQLLGGRQNGPCATTSTPRVSSVRRRPSCTSTTRRISATCTR